MKLVTFVEGDKGPRPGLVVDGGIIDLSTEGFKDSLAFLAAASSVQADVAKSKPTIAMDKVKLLAPVAPPRIFGIGVNYAEHALESKTETQAVPTVFIVLSSSVVGPDADVILPRASVKVDYEAELAVVIGKPGYQVPAAKAMEHVFGYTIMNDMTGNAMRSEDRVHYYALYASEADSTIVERREQHLSYAARYKGSDGFGPMGPWLVTRDSILDPGALDVTCKMGDEVIAEDSTRYLTYSVAEILAYISRYQTLEPGDIISMGTAFKSKPGAARSLHGADLQRVDGPVSVEITGLGTLCTPVKRRQMALGEWRLR